MNSEITKFTDAVWSNVHADTIFSPADVESVKDCIRRLYAKGFSVVDATLFCECLKEVDPFLDENEALKRMTILKAKNKKAPPAVTSTVFVVWTEGDTTMVAGTFTAKVSMDPVGVPSDEWIEAAKNSLAGAFASIWNVRVADVHLMTERELEDDDGEV